MSDLKPCPFCGSSNTTLDYYEISCPQELGTIVVCNDCGASAKSIVDWNTRPIEDALNKRIAQLEAELKITELNGKINCITGWRTKTMTDKNANTEIRKEFCPNCEKDTECIHAAELYECQECGEDFAKYIVSRNCNVSDVSMTRDVSTDIKTPSSIENNNPDYYKDDVGKWIPIASGRLPEKFQECIVLDKNKRVHNWIHYDALLPLFAQFTHWMPLPELPEEVK